MNSAHPSLLGLKRSFGFGDRLGLATPGHMDAVKGTPFAPVFAQQSMRELARTRRRPEDVMNAAVNAVKEEEWDGDWGADADHLQTEDDVRRMAGAGFTFFTIDPSEWVNNPADSMGEESLVNAFCHMVDRGVLNEEEVFDHYLGRKITVDEGVSFTFRDRVELLRAAVKYGGALHHARRMYGWIEEACGDRLFEVEISVDETETPTSPLEHLFIGLELKRLGVKVVSLAPRFIGDFEKGIDYRGDLATFEDHYAKHAAIARACGPYKLSIHSGSDKFSLYPVIGRMSGDLLHVKTAGTSYLEGLRVVCRTDRALFREIVAFCRTRYETDRATYHVSAVTGDVPDLIPDEELEAWYLENDSGRQILHVTFGSVLSGGLSTDGVPFQEKILANLTDHAGLYREVLREHLGKHLRLLYGARTKSAE